MINEKIENALHEALKSTKNNELTWKYMSNIESIAIVNKDTNKYKEFIDRNYLLPLNVVFKNDEMINRFRYGIAYEEGPKGNTLYFSKKIFFKNIISNLDELEIKNGEDIYKSLKKPFRQKKDIYRDVNTNMKKSKFYKEVLAEYNQIKRKISFEEYVKLCRQKYTRLLSGYNVVIDFFKKPLDIKKFIKCFSIDQLYLFTCKSIIESNKRNKAYKDSKIIKDYISLVKDIRKKDQAYNCHIIVKKEKYTIDDLIAEIEK